MTVRNVGARAAAATTLRYYQSDDPTITTSDTEMVTDAVAGLAASKSTSQSSEVTAPIAPGTYYFGACVDAVTDETDTTNNCSAAVAITVQDTAAAQQGHPDLMVASPSVSHSSPPAGARFTVSATVRNGGGGPSATTTLRYYGSSDGTITTSDTEVGTAEVAALSASGSTTESVELTAPATPGTYYYGACVDSVSDETDTTNNCSASVRITLLEPDLVVGSPSVSDGGPAVGAQFTLSATVRNDGAGSGAATTLRYYRSPDATISTSDTEVGRGPVAGLAGSGSSSQSVDLVAPATPGIYYYGACVDAVTDESDTTNNCSTSVQVTVQQTVTERQGDPDLTVTSAAVSDSGPTVGAKFTLSATVKNGGAGGAETTTLRYYRSADATITSADTEVGTDTITGLAASGSAGQSVELTAPSTPGTYYYGACVDAVTDESDTTNNCSTSVQVTVPQPARPDLMVTSPSVSDSGPATGARFTLSASVRNGGNGDAPATTLRYYRSADAAITTSDTQVGTDAISELAASGSAGQSVALTAPATPGTYYYGACVDAVTDESDTTNNCSGSVKVAILQPDLVVGAPSASKNDPEPGAQFTLSVTVQNNGEGQSDATTLRYYYSTDTAITTSDTALDTDAIGGLAAPGTSSQSVDLTAPSTPGTYYYGACVDAVTDESDTTNNCSASVQVTVPQPKPDLVVRLPSVDDSGPAGGAPFALSATVENDGEGSASATTLRYYQSADATISTSDREVGADAIGGLAASGTSSQSVDLTAPSTPGTYYYGACVDAVTDESDTTNNCSASVQVTVPQPKPDLVVGAPTVDHSGPAAGAAFTLLATVENDGEGSASATTLRYYQSADATISTSDTEVGADAIGGLAASGTSSQSADLTAPSTPGTYYYGACVDAVTGESDTTNNCSASVQVTVPQPKPDLVVGSPSVDDSGPAAGAAFMLSATVENEGGGAAAATTLRYYRSTDMTIATSDTEVGTDAISELAASGSSRQSVGLTAPETAGTYNYGACVDAVTDESDTTNNCSASVQVTIPEAEQQGPSVKISAEDDKEWAPVGDTVDLSARVLDEEGEEVTGATVTWSSSNTAVATVNSLGVMTAVGEGTVTLTATATVSSSSTQSSMAKSVAASSRVSGGAVVKSEETVSGFISMTVVKRAARIEMAPDSLSFDTVGDIKILTATVYDADNQVMQPHSFSLRWATANEEVATVSYRPSAGVQASVHSVGEGTTTITLYVSGSATGTATVTVTLPTARVTVEPASLNFKALGVTKTVTVRVLDENDVVVEGASFYANAIYHPCCRCCGEELVVPIARKMLDDGMELTSKGPGTGKLTIRSEGVASAILLVHVYQYPATLTVSPDSASLEVDGTATLRASVMDANGNDMPVVDRGREGRAVVYWETSDSTVATVDGSDAHADRNTGATTTVTAVAAGTATITGHSGTNAIGTATVTVTD